MTLFGIVAWFFVIVAAVIVLLFIALCIRLVPAVLQERALSRLEAEQVDAELRQQDGPLTPHVPKQWQTQEHRDTGGK